MRHTLENNVLTFYLEGELNSYSAKSVEKEIEAVMSKNTFNKIIIDLKDLVYISSAGLRIILIMKQKCDDTSLINTPSGVYDIFKMVGFDNLIKIEKL